MSTLETQYRKFLEANQKLKISFEEWKKINARLIKQALINMMKDDEELGLYDETECYCGHTTTCDCGPEESYMDFTGELDGLPNLSDIIKEKYPEQETLEEATELNPYIGPFLLNNNFEKKENNTYINSECTIIVTKDYYEVQFIEPGFGEVSMYTDSLSIYHLVGILTWFNLINKNYKK